MLDVLADRTHEFERAFAEASAIISSAPGYLSHELQRCIETPERYVLLVRWETLEDHTEGFRGSDAYGEWKRLLHHFYDPFPTVQHFETVGWRAPGLAHPEPRDREDAERALTRPGRLAGTRRRGFGVG